jgi:hypothetical protein
MPIMPGMSIEAIDEPGAMVEDIKFSGEKTWRQSLDIGAALRSVGAAFVKAAKKPNTIENR